MRIWKTGERCRITYKARELEAVIVLASENGRSLFLEFDGMLGGFAGKMPLLWHDEDEKFHDLTEGAVAVLTGLAPN